MESTSDSLALGVIMLAAVGWLIPWASIGAALALHLLRLPEDAPAYVAYMARANDPHHPTNLLGRLHFAKRDYRAVHSIHSWAAFENVIIVVLCNLLPLAANLVSDPYYTPGPLLRLFTLAFFICEGFWFWWYWSFVSQNRVSG